MAVLILSLWSIGLVSAHIPRGNHNLFLTTVKPLLRKTHQINLVIIDSPFLGMLSIMNDVNMSVWM